MYKNNQTLRGKQATRSEQLEQHLYEFLGSLLWGLNEQIDRRLVQTFLGLVMAIIIHRHRNHGLLLSELGGLFVRPGTVLCWHKADQQPIA